ncbi:MAG: 2,3-bisphosphoglycerate-dependent phosphoglycerate mutase [Streptosporangiaceae bacterium]
MATLVLLRHGESVWNSEGLFTGWVDVDLSATGEVQAARCGELLLDADITPTVVHTSLLKSAIRTANIALDVVELLWIPVRRSWRLNAQHQGALQGRNAAQIGIEHGAESLDRWRTSYEASPPPIPDSSSLTQIHDLRYRSLPSELIPRTESMADVTDRLLPYWYDVIVPDLAAGHVVVVVAHDEPLRALIKHLDDIPDEEISSFELPVGVPLLYELSDDFWPRTPGGKVLDPQADKDLVMGPGRHSRLFERFFLPFNGPEQHDSVEDYARQQHGQSEHPSGI